jgi:shikimate dehydrogenase
MKKDLLHTLRKRIEALDLDLLRILNERAAVSLEIGKLKARKGLEIRDPWREQTVFDYLAEYNKGPLRGEEVENIFRRILAVSRGLQTAVSSRDLSPPSEGPATNLSFTPSATTSLYGILGNPVGQSMSPCMHNTAFRILGLDAIYLPFEVKDLERALIGIKALKIKGASVTHPFKEKILQFVDHVEDTAKRIGAINTLAIGKDGIRGSNTDWLGAVRCLETLLPIDGHTFVVIGAGGAARAVVFGIVTNKGKAIVASRSLEKGRNLAKEFGATAVPLSDLEGLGGDCLVNTTPVGMHPRTHDLPVPKEVLESFRAVADVVYNPLKTMLLREAEAAGCATASGFEMFVYQGVEQFRTWTGKTPPVEAMRDVVYERLSSP